MKISNEFKIGIMAILVVGLSIWGYKFLKGKNLLKPSNIFYVRYENVASLAATSPVMIRGMNVGTVSDVSLDKDMVSIIVTLDLKKGIDIPKDAEAVIVSTGLMGGKAIDLIVKQACSGDGCAEPGTFLNGRAKGLFESFLDPGEDGTLAKVKENIGDILNTLGDSLTSPNANNEIAKTVGSIVEGLLRFEESNRRRRFTTKDGCSVLSLLVQDKSKCECCREGVNRWTVRYSH